MQRHRYRFFVLLTPPLFHLSFWGVPVAPDRPSWGQLAWRIGLKLFGRKNIFWKNSNLCEKHTSTSQTDGRTDDMQSHNRTLGASRGKNYKKVYRVVQKSDTPVLISQ